LQDACEEDDTMTVEDKLTADVQRLAASIKVGSTVLQKAKHDCLKKQLSNIHLAAALSSA
jgi:hypothetical protein